MLKIATHQAEIRGNAVMSWWAGGGSAPVIAVDGAAVLMARASEPGTLVAIIEQGGDDEAIRTIAEIATALHAPRNSPPPEGLPPLESWFAVLPTAVERLGGPLHASAAAAEALLATQTDRVVLHGDLHHENVLHFGESGWLAIDPKGVVGERALDYVQHVFDPDDENVPPLEVLEHRLALSAEFSGFDVARLRLWLLAWAGLEAAWWAESGGSPLPSLAVAAALAATSDAVSAA